MSLVQASTVPSRMRLCHLRRVLSSVESQESTVRPIRGFPKHTLECGCSMESFAHTDGSFFCPLMLLNYGHLLIGSSL